MSTEIRIDGFVLTEVQAEGIFYKLTFEREITKEQLMGNNPPKVESVSKNKQDIEDLQRYVQQGMQAVVEFQGGLHGYPQKGPRQAIHMHLLKSEHPWVKELHIEDAHNIEITPD